MVSYKTGSGNHYADDVAKFLLDGKGLGRTHYQQDLVLHEMVSVTCWSGSDRVLMRPRKRFEDWTITLKTCQTCVAE